MANHPEPNNHPEQPDDANKNPTPSESSDGGTADLHAEDPASSDSFIDLGMPGGPADPFASDPPSDSHDPSDLSIVEWAALVGEVPADTESPSSPAFDRPSDQDWAPQATNPPAGSGKPDTQPMVDNAGRPETHHALDVASKPVTHHALDVTELLGDAALVNETPPSSAATEPLPPPHEPGLDAPLLTDESSAEQESLEADLEVVRQTFNLDELDSKKKLAASSAAAPLTPPPTTPAPDHEDVFEEVNLTPKPDGSSGSFSSSGVNLQQLDSGSFESIIDAVAAEADAPAGPTSSVDLGSAELPAAPRLPGQGEIDQPPSGRDLIAEAVESGVDMQQPLMEIVNEETLAEEEALEANEVVESSGKMKQPTMEIVEGEDALLASEVVESSGTMKQPLMDIVEEEEALEASEVVESSGSMKQPLMDIVNEEPAAEASAGVVESSSDVDLGGQVATETLTSDELDALVASQEMGSAAETPVKSVRETDQSPELPGGRKTLLAGQHPVRATQLQDSPFDAEAEAAAAAAFGAPEAPATADARKTQLAGSGPARLTQLYQPDEVVVDAGEVVEEPVVDAGEVVEEVAVDAGEVVMETATEPAGPAEKVDEAGAPIEEVDYDAGGAVGDDVSEIILQSDTPVLDSSEHLGELTEIDPEEVQLGVGAPEEEEAPAAVDEAEEKPAKPVKPPKSRTPVYAFVGGGFAGTLVGAGCVAILVFTGLVGPKATPPKATEPPKTTNPQPTPVAVTFPDKLNHLRNGDLDKADLDKIDEAKPEQQVARGEFRWRKYVQTQAKASAPFKKDDDLAKQAIADLTTVSQKDDKQAAADALFNLAQIDELTNDLPAALKKYEDGAKKYENDPKLKRRFDAARNRLTSGPGNPGGVGRLLDPQRPLDEQTLALAVLILLYAPADDDTDNEAGFGFWDAVKLASTKKYDDAIKALDAARALHEKRRFLHPGKGQNPQSDPKEDIFLRACDELKTYWLIQDKLNKRGYLTLDDALKSVDDTKKQLVDANKKIVDDKTKADTEIATLNKTLTEQQKKADTDTAALKKTLTEQQKKSDLELAAEKTKSAKLANDLKVEKDMLVQVKKELANAQEIVKEKDPQGMIRKLQTEVSDTKATLKERWEPQDMLAIWLPVLQDRSQKDLAAKAKLDADRVLKDAKSKPDQKAKALALTGLVLRNEDKFDEAKSKLEEAKKGLGADSAWLTPVDAALKEVSDPTATYLARVEVLRNEGKYDDAVASLKKVLDTLPPDKSAELYADQSLLRLEAIRAKNRGPLAADDPAVKAALDDANKSAASGVPQGFYAVGRLAEELRQLPEAVVAYTKAVEATPLPLTARSSRYRVALARAVQATKGKLDEAAKMRNEEVLNAPPGVVPFDVRAQALAVKGLYTQALITDAEGLRTQLKPDYADGLMALIENHPTLRRPESSNDPNPLTAEKHYGAGLRWYYERNYANAEQEFLEAIKNDKLDARYFYFLGLSRLAQNNKDAHEDFVQGAKLELQERPSRAAVSTALERVQGPMREELNEVRRQAH